MAYSVGPGNVTAPLITALVSVTTPLLTATTANIGTIIGGANITASSSLTTPIVNTDLIQNKTTNGSVTIQTLGANAPIYVSPHGTASVVIKAGCAIVTDACSSDILQNKTGNAAVLIRTLGLEAPISLSPHGNGGVIVKPGCPLIADTLSADYLQPRTIDAAITLRSLTANANVNLSPHGTGSVVVNAGSPFVADAVTSDLVQNKTASGTVTIQTLAADAAINVSPHGTGSVIVKSGCPLIADTLRPSAGLALGLVTNGSTRLTIPDAGIASGSTSANLVTMNGTALETRTVGSLAQSGSATFDWSGFTEPITCAYTYCIVPGGGPGLVTVFIGSFTGTKSGSGHISSPIASIPFDARPNSDFVEVITYKYTAFEIVTVGQMIVRADGSFELYGTATGGGFDDGDIIGSNARYYFSYLNF